MAGLGFSWGQNQGQGRSYGGDYQGGLLTRALGATFGDSAPGVDWWTRFSNPEYNTALLDRQRSMAEWEAKRKEFEPFVNEMQRSFEAGDEHGALNNAMLLGQVLMKNGLDPQGAIDLYKNTGEAYRANKMRTLDTTDAGAYPRSLGEVVNTPEQAIDLSRAISGADVNKAQTGEIGARTLKTNQETAQGAELFPIQKEGEGLKNSLTGAQIGEVGARTLGQTLENQFVQTHGGQRPPTLGYGGGEEKTQPWYKAAENLTNYLTGKPDAYGRVVRPDKPQAEAAVALYNQSFPQSPLQLTENPGAVRPGVDGKPPQQEPSTWALTPASPPPVPGGGVPVDTSGAPRRAPQAPPQQQDTSQMGQADPNRGGIPAALQAIIDDPKLTRDQKAALLHAKGIKFRGEQ